MPSVFVPFRSALPYAVLDAVEPGSAAPGTTVGQLIRAAKAYAAERKRVQAGKWAEDGVRRQPKAAFAREKYLDNLAG